MSTPESPDSAPSAPTPDAPPAPIDKDAAKDAIRHAQESGESIDKLPRQSPSELASLADAIDALPEKSAQAWTQMYPQPPTPKKKVERDDSDPAPKKETPAKPQKRTFAQLWFGE